MSEKCSSGPAIEPWVQRQRCDEARETRPIFRPVGKRIGPGKILDISFGEAGRRVLETNGAFEAKLRGPVCETSGCDMISEDIPRPGKLAWLGRDFELGLEYFLVLVVTRTQHDPVLAECDRLLIVVGRNVPDSENRHCGPTRMRPNNKQFLCQCQKAADCTRSHLSYIRK